MSITPGTAIAANTPAARTSISQPVPSVAPGTLLLWTYTQSTATVVLPSTPAGWGVWQAGTIVGTGSQLGSVTWFKFASASEPASYDLNGLTSGRHASYMMPYSGVDSTNPQDVANRVTSSTTGHATLFSITPVTPGAYVIGMSTDGAPSGVVNTTYSTTATNGVVDVSSSSTSPTTVNTACGEMHAPWVSGSLSPGLTPSGSASIQRSIACTSALRPASVTSAKQGTFMPYFI